MDISKLKGKLATLIGKYKYVLLILCVGLVLILLPTGTAEKKTDPTVTAPQGQTHISQVELASILTRIEGAGRVEVLLSLEYSAQTQYQQNTDTSASTSERTTTVTVTDSQRNESGLINKTCAPIYRGAIIVCEGADDPVVHYNVVNAVANITGLRSNQISVLKMK